MRSLMTTTIACLIAANACAQLQPDESGPLIDAGDPRAVPLILARLGRASAEPIEQNRSNVDELVAACREAAMYQLDEAGPAMVRAYRAMPREASSGFLVGLAWSAARYRTPAAMSFQRALLADERLTGDQDRVPLLAALAEGGDEVAIEALATFVQTQLARIASTGGASGDLTSTVPLVRSTALSARLAAIAPPENPPARKTLESIRERMALNGQPPSALMDLIEHAPAASTRRVGDALLVLGRVGTPADIARLQTLPLGENDAMRENDRLIAWRDDAVAAIRRRHWRELSAATQPAEGR